ncbi:MAG: hypothetical protein LBJ31_11530 [Treponema sp.]|jgi:hypothetical protein|nr:hypothetical protein [Treponema sp.]
MFGFLLKKTFYDLWDHLFSLLLLNLIFMALFFTAFFLPALFSSAQWPLFKTALFCACFFAMSLHVSAASGCVNALSSERNFDKTGYVRLVIKAFKPALFLALIAAVPVFIFAVVIPFYLGTGSFFGIVTALFCSWMLLFGAAALQFFPVLYWRLEKRPLKAVKKCFLVFFDNVLLSLFLLVFNGVLCIFIFPCPSIPLLYLDEALRLLLLKYDWIETHPPGNEAARQKVPWDEILAEEKEKTGNRTWRDFIFPWRN